MTNLLKETIKTIEVSGHTTNDIIFIGSKCGNYSCIWSEFEKLADQDYESGVGAQKVAQDLIIVFRDGGTMWRHEHNGSEYWEHWTPFCMPKITSSIKSLFAKDAGWQDLQEIHAK